MSDRSIGEPVLQRVCWPDASLEHFAADYDAVALRIRELSGRVLLIHCEGYIGYGLDGFWDETFIERVELVEDHPAIERYVKNISTRHDSGNEQRNTRRWKALIIHLGDGCCLEIVAARFSVGVAR